MEPPTSDDLQVLSIVHSAAFGGPHNQAVQLHRELARSGAAQLTVVLPDEPGDAPDRLAASGRVPPERSKACSAWSPATPARSCASDDW